MKNLRTITVKIFNTEQLRSCWLRSWARGPSGGPPGWVLGAGDHRVVHPGGPGRRGPSGGPPGWSWARGTIGWSTRVVLGLKGDNVLGTSRTSGGWWTSAQPFTPGQPVHVEHLQRWQRTEGVEVEVEV
ncbi:unnamed protein product [Boreogadus saida]